MSSVYCHRGVTSKFSQLIIIKLRFFFVCVFFPQTTKLINQIALVVRQLFFSSRKLLDHTFMVVRGLNSCHLSHATDIKVFICVSFCFVFLP